MLYYIILILMVIMNLNELIVAVLSLSAVATTKASAPTVAATQKAVLVPS
jgi:hypothetical protein